MHRLEQRTVLVVKIHIVRAENRHLYESELDQHHRIRRDIYIGEKRWAALREYDGREIDQFDTPDTIYVLGLDDSSGVICGSRLHPSLGPTLLSDVFPQLANVRGFERAPDIYEWTRVFVVPAKREGSRSSVYMGLILCGFMHYCLEEGIRALNVVTETFWLPRFIGLGWKLQVLGEPIEHDGMSICASNIIVTDETVAAMSAHYSIARPNLVRRGLTRPPSHPPLHPAQIAAL
jgi:acyl-homoserine lactone synthase